jgi:hypothetical protein
MIHNKQLPAPKGPPPKPKREPRHWSQQIQETVASAIHEESLTISLKGGADSGLFVYLGSIDHNKISYHGEKLFEDDILLEVQGQKVSGYTLRDATVWMKQVSQNGAPVMIKTVRPGKCRSSLSSSSENGEGGDGSRMTWSLVQPSDLLVFAFYLNGGGAAAGV